MQRKKYQRRPAPIPTTPTPTVLTTTKTMQEAHYMLFPREHGPKACYSKGFYSSTSFASILLALGFIGQFLIVEPFQISRGGRGNEIRYLLKEKSNHLFSRGLILSIACYLCAGYWGQPLRIIQSYIIIAGPTILYWKLILSYRELSLFGYIINGVYKSMCFVPIAVANGLPLINSIGFAMEWCILSILHAFTFVSIPYLSQQTTNKNTTTTISEKAMKTRMKLSNQIIIFSILWIIIIILINISKVINSDILYILTLIPSLHSYVLFSSLPTLLYFIFINIFKTKIRNQKQLFIIDILYSIVSAIKCALIVLAY